MFAMETASGSPCSRRKFSLEEDQLLRSLVEKHGARDWFTIASFMTGRSVRQCKERWENYLSQAVDGPQWTAEEDLRLQRTVCERGHKWKALEIHFPGRTDIQLKNRYNVILRRQNRLSRIPARQPRGDRLDPTKISVDHGENKTDGAEFEVDWASQWVGSECEDPEPWDRWMVGEFSAF
jgi:hypothetical protein